MAVNPEFKAHEITEDPIVNEVIDLIIKRHMQGMTKFGKTMADSERPFDEWVDETIEELLDAIHYLVKSKTILDKFKANQKKLEAALSSLQKDTFTNEEAKEES